MKTLRTIAAIIALGSGAAASAEDWPQWRGLHRDGIWRETGILQSVPPEGLKILWRVPVGTGFSSPVVVQLGRHVSGHGDSWRHPQRSPSGDATILRIGLVAIDLVTVRARVGDLIGDLDRGIAVL